MCCPVACVVAVVILPSLNHAMVTLVLNIYAALRAMSFSVHKLRGATFVVLSWKKGLEFMFVADCN